MKRYVVRLLGEGISLHVDEAGVAVGFYTTRSVLAKDEYHAIEKVRDVVLAEWLDGDLARLNSGGLPALSVDVVGRAGLFRGFLRRSGG